MERSLDTIPQAYTSVPPVDRAHHRAVQPIGWSEVDNLFIPQVQTWVDRAPYTVVQSQVSSWIMDRFLDAIPQPYTAVPPVRADRAPHTAVQPRGWGEVDKLFVPQVRTWVDRAPYTAVQPTGRAR